MNDPFVGSLTFMRIYSGLIEVGSSVLILLKIKENVWKNVANAF